MTNTQYKSVQLCASFQCMHDTRHLWIHLNEELKLFPPWLWMCRHWQYLTEFRFLVSMIMALAMWNLNFKDKGVVSTREPEQWLRGLLLTKPLKEDKHYPFTMNKCNLTLKLTHTHTPKTLIYTNNSHFTLCSGNEDNKTIFQFSNQYCFWNM